MYHVVRKYLILLAVTPLAFSCVDLVEDGIDIDYPESNAVLTVEALNRSEGAAGEIISFEIAVQSDSDIKSCIVQSNNVGENGSGFNVSSSNYDDPFADHIFGTVRKDVRSFKVRYDYIIPPEIRRARLTFSVISETGKASVEKVVEVVPDIKRYPDRNIYAKDKTFFDALASVDGTVYGDVKSNYSTLSQENVDVQAKIDIMFYYDPEARQSLLFSPASERADLELNIENQTLFMRLDINDVDLANVSPADLLDLTSNEAIANDGRAQIGGLKVGDMIAFLTDLNAQNALKLGLLKVTGLHPTSIARYDGVSYVLECDIIVQN